MKTSINSNSINSGTQYTFRPIQKEDNLQVAKLIKTVMTEYDCVGEGYSINDPEVDDMFGTYNDERSAFFVIENEGRILGCGGIAPLAGGDADTCELRKMYFYNELRGKGWGRKTVKHCLEVAKKIGYKKCYLETVERMHSANILYQKMGFEKSCSSVGNTGHGSCDSYYVREL